VAMIMIGDSDGGYNGDGDETDDDAKQQR
jgi:hypothetical protein